MATSSGKPSKGALSKAGKALASNGSSKPAKCRAGENPREGLTLTRPLTRNRAGSAVRVVGNHRHVRSHLSPLDSAPSLPAAIWHRTSPPGERKPVTADSSAGASHCAC